MRAYSAGYHVGERRELAASNALGFAQLVGHVEAFALMDSDRSRQPDESCGEFGE
jgi:hypothetical protein